MKVLLCEMYDYWGNWEPQEWEAEDQGGQWELLDLTWGEIKRVSQEQFLEWQRTGCLRLSLT